MTKDGGNRPDDILATQFSWVLHPTLLKRKIRKMETTSTFAHKYNQIIQ